MSYVDAMLDREKEVVKVVERSKDGKRLFRDFPVKYTFFVPDPKGKYTSIYGEPLQKIVCKNLKEFRRELAINSGKRLYEADFKPTLVCLSENYQKIDAPKLNVAFFDIEVDMQPYAVNSQKLVQIRRKRPAGSPEQTITVFQLGERVSKEDLEVLDDSSDKWVDAATSRYLEPGPGYASPDDPFMPITAIAVHLQWLDMLVCLALPPKTITFEQAQEQVADFPNTFLFRTEYEMLDTFLNLIEDADVLSGWNSEGFDIPYTVNRVAKVLSKDDTRRFCLWDQFPKRREYEKFGKTAVTYDLVGRVHLDSLELYRKYNSEERHSYRLDAIGEIELGETKVQYEGTLDQLYNNDFRKFIEYNRQDTALLDKLDKELKYLTLANKYAHENTVLLPQVMGAVAVSEQALINEAHQRGLRIPNRKHRDENEDVQAAGAYVAFPKTGIHDWIGSLDINSLYPSVIRALNMSNETIIGQLRQTATDEFIKTQMGKGKSFAASWEGRFGSLEYEAVMNREIGTEITIDWEGGGSDVLSAAEVYRLIFESNNPFMLSANGTIFTYEKEGLVPGLLKRWYAERKVMQAELKAAINIRSGIEIDDEFAKLLAA